MATVIRLQRGGRKKRPFYSIVVMDKRNRRDGAFIEKLGTYDPCTHPEAIVIDLERVNKWLAEGAQASGRVTSLIALAQEDPAVSAGKAKQAAEKKAAARKGAEEAAGEAEAKAAAEEEASAEAAETEAPETVSEETPEDPEAEKAGAAEAEEGPVAGAGETSAEADSSDKAGEKADA